MGNLAFQFLSLLPFLNKFVFIVVFLSVSRIFSHLNFEKNGGQRKKKVLISVPDKCEAELDYWSLYFRTAKILFSSILFEYRNWKV